LDAAENAGWLSAVGHFSAAYLAPEAIRLQGLKALSTLYPKTVGLNRLRKNSKDFRAL
jgi:hypothetical protein